MQKSAANVRRKIAKKWPPFAAFVCVCAVGHGRELAKKDERGHSAMPSMFIWSSFNYFYAHLAVPRPKRKLHSVAIAVAAVAAFLFYFN